MPKKSQNIINKLYPLSFLLLILVIWQVICSTGLVPAFMLPSPAKVISALFTEAPVWFGHLLVTLKEALIGMTASIIAAFALAIIMDRFEFLNKALYPVIVLSQTIPVIAIAPLLVLWLGYGILPKIVLIFLVCFFPLVVSLMTGFQAVDRDIVRLFKSMGASNWQILWQVKIPASMDNFFAGLKIAAAYAIVGAVIAEWLGGNNGLGVYMTRLRKGYAFDKMFAVIFLISMLSLVLMKLVAFIQKKSMPWKQLEK